MTPGTTRCLDFYAGHLHRLIGNMDNPDPELTDRALYARNCAMITAATPEKDDGKPVVLYGDRTYNCSTTWMKRDPAQLLRDKDYGTHGKYGVLGEVLRMYGWTTDDLTVYVIDPGFCDPISVHVQPTLTAAYNRDPAFLHGALAVIRNQYNNDLDYLRRNWSRMDFTPAEWLRWSRYPVKCIRYKAKGYFAGKVEDDIDEMEHMLKVLERNDNWRNFGEPYQCN